MSRVRHVAAAIAALTGCGEPAVAPRPPASGPDIVLISLDTTRADALGCDGERPIGPAGSPTPNLDALAAGGSWFSAARTHAPTTLNSHSSMFTGRDPHGHGVPRNGFPLDARIPTLPERLSLAGYDTIAVVGSAALAHDMGLARGFRVYDDAMPEDGQFMAQDTADGVTDRALDAIDGREDRPLFLFVHYYDAHAPYLAPEPFRRRFVDPGYSGNIPLGDGLGELNELMLTGKPDPAMIAAVDGAYLGEVSYVDRELQRLLDGIREAGLDPIVIVTADHGETLSELPGLAWSHGSGVDDGAMRVPLIVSGPGLAEGRRLADPVVTSDIAPTVERLAGLDATLGDGVPFDRLLSGPIADSAGWPDGPARIQRLEATRPRADEPAEGWNNARFMRGVVAGPFGVRGAPELGVPFAFEGTTDPALRADLQRMLSEWDARAPAHRGDGQDAETTRILQALGYVDGGQGAER